MKSNKKKNILQLPGVIWGGNDGAVYYLERIGNILWWAGLSDGGEGTTFTNVFKGVVRGRTVSGSWTDVPRGSAALRHGTITLRLVIDQNGGELGPITKLRVVRQTGGFRATELELQA